MGKNTVGKGGIARHKQFLLFISVFKIFMQTHKNKGLIGRGLSVGPMTLRP